jgi:hypothetical protein
MSAQHTAGPAVADEAHSPPGPAADAKALGSVRWPCRPPMPVESLVVGWQMKPAWLPCR